MGPPSNPPPPFPFIELAMIATLQRHIASLEDAINRLRLELAKLRGEATPATDPAALAAPTAAAAMTTAAPAKKAAPKNPQQACVLGSSTARVASGWQLVGRCPNSRPRTSQAQQPSAPSHGVPPPPLPSPIPVHVDGEGQWPAEFGAPHRMHLPGGTPPRPPLRFLAARLGKPGHQSSPGQHHPLGRGWRRGGHPPPPPDESGWQELSVGGTVRDSGLPPRRGASGAPRVQPTAAALWACCSRRRRCSRTAFTKVSPRT